MILVLFICKFTYSKIRVHNMPKICICMGGLPNPPTQVTTHRLVGDAYCIMRRKPLLSNIPDGGHADSGHPLWQTQGHLHSLFNINRRNDTFVESFE